MRLDAVATAVAGDERYCGLAVGELATAARARFAGVVANDDPLRIGGPPVRLATL